MQALPQLHSYLAALPDWIAWLVVAVVVTWTMVAYGLLLSRAGRGPLWGLLVLLPFVGVLVLWWAALARWPRERGRGAG